MKIMPSLVLLSTAFLITSSALSQEEGDSISITPTPAAQNATSPHAALQPAGQVVWVSGTVKASYPEQTPRVLARGAVVYEKDTIVTDDSSSGQISFTDNSMITLNPKSSLVIEQYYFDQQKPAQGGQTVLNLLKGGFRTITGFVAKTAPANYQMKTPVATIGVRGTDYQGSCVSAGSCAFALLGGKGLVLNNAAGTYELTPETPYASIAGFTTQAVITKVPSGMLGKPPIITPANAPPPNSNKGGGNCGILIN